MTWRRVEMAEALRWFAQKYLTGERATAKPYEGPRPPEASAHTATSVLSDGSVILAESVWSGRCSEFTPDHDADPPVFYVGEP